MHSFRVSLCKTMWAKLIPQSEPACIQYLVQASGGSAVSSIAMSCFAPNLVSVCIGAMCAQRALFLPFSGDFPSKPSGNRQVGKHFFFVLDDIMLRLRSPNKIRISSQQWSILVQPLRLYWKRVSQTPVLSRDVNWADFSKLEFNTLAFELMLARPIGS